MEIKYLDKFYKKLKDDVVFQEKIAFGAGVSIFSATIFTISVYSGIMLHDREIKNKIMNASYIVENNESYQIKDIFILSVSSQRKVYCVMKEKKTSLNF